MKPQGCNQHNLDCENSHRAKNVASLTNKLNINKNKNKKIQSHLDPNSHKLLKQKL